MHKEYNNLDEVGGLTINDSALNQANILQELKKHQEHMSLRMEQIIKVNLITALTGICGDMGNENTPPMHDFNAANNTRNLASGNKAAILQLLTNLQNKVEQLTNNNSSNQSQGGGTNDNQDLLSSTPILGRPTEDTAGHTAVVAIGGAPAKTKRQDTKMRRL